MDTTCASSFFSALGMVRATVAEHRVSVDACLKENTFLCSQSRVAIEESWDLLSKLKGNEPRTRV
jgi:hypothetical protein